VNDYVNHLLSCRESHLQAISLIDQLLVKAGTQAMAVPPPPLVDEATGKPQRTGRKQSFGRRNATSKSVLLRNILLEADRPLKLHEILKEMVKRGYQFASVYPKSTLNPLLYGNARLEFVARTSIGFVYKGRGKDFGVQELDSAPVVAT
jgi:hypothetical protein